MQTEILAKLGAAVKRPTDLTQYAHALHTYPATMEYPYGVTVTGTCRELYVHEGAWLEWKARNYYERTLIRRSDPRLTLTEEMP